MNLDATPVAKAVADQIDIDGLDEAAKSVEQWLREVVYGDNSSYIPSIFALQFVDFIKMVNGNEGEENKTPVLHLRMLDQIGSGETRIANMVFRGAAKTTVMGEYLFLYIALYGSLPGLGKVDLALYVSDSIDNGVKNMRKNLEFRWENSEFLKKYIPQTSFTDIRWKFTNLDGKVFIVKGYGAKTGVRGAKEMGKRPQLAVLDDLVSDEDARSPTVIAAIEDTVYKAVDYALHPKKNMIIWSGTPFNAKDPLYKAVESGAWKVNVYPVCERFPCSREEFKGAWPDRFTYDFVLQKYTLAKKAGKIETFNQELMLQIMSDEDRLIQDGEVAWYMRRNVLDNKKRYNFYITTDFATSAKKASDFSVISVWAYSHNEDWLWVDGICERQDMGANLDDLFRLCARWRPLGVGIEVSGQQGGYIPLIQREMVNKDVYFHMVSEKGSSTPGLRPTTNKLERFMAMVPHFKRGKMFFPYDMKSTRCMVEFEDEIRLASAGGFRSKHDDFLDTISMLALMNAIPPSQEIRMEYNESDMIWEEATSHEPTYSAGESYIV
ncbi:terminase large subunit [Pseudomonas phage vB_PaeP_FBPa1]|nr:terminase large subunit [Pseudomonas phage vB_PaeP_FBPa1]